MGQSLPGACKLRSIATMVFGLVSEWNAMQRTFTVVSLDLRYQPQATFDFSSSAVQRLRPVGADRRTHADCQEAAVAYSARCWPERRLSKVLRS